LQSAQRDLKQAKTAKGFIKSEANFFIVSIMFHSKKLGKANFILLVRRFYYLSLPKYLIVKTTMMILLTLLMPAMNYGQAGVVSGIVTIGGKGAEYVSVQILHTATGTKSDAAGRYALNNIPEGSYDISYSYTGYQTETKHVTIHAGEQLTVDITLHENHSNLDEVVVTGVSRATELRKSPVPMVVVNRQEMEAHVSNNIIDAIVQGTPGVAAVTTGPNISKPFIRGLGYYRVLSLYDGIRQEGQQWGDEHGIEIDQYVVDRGEVVKGPASLVYGSDATAGVINMIPHMPAMGRGLTGDAVLDYHSNNGMAGTSVGLGKRTENIFWTVRGSAKVAHDYKNRADGYVYNTGFREYNFSSKAGITRKWGGIQAGVTVYDNMQEIPDGSRDSATRRFTKQVNEADSDNVKDRPQVSDAELRSYSISALHQHIQHLRAYTHGQLKFDNGSELRGSFAVQQSIRREYNHPQYPQQAGLYVVLNTLNYELKYDLKTWKHIETTVGVNGMWQTNTSKDATDFPIPDYSLLDAGAFVMAQRSWDKVQLSGGVRYDTRHVNWDDFYVGKNAATGFAVHARDTAGAMLQFPAFRHQYTGISGSVGMAYTLSSKWLLKANIARGYRAPNITETGSNGLDPGAHIVYQGNRDFKPEFTLQEDIGVIATLAGVVISAELFNNHIDNYIYQARAYDAAGNPIVIVPGNTTYKYQQAAARLYGGEVSVSVAPRKVSWLKINQSLSYTEGLNLSPALRDQYQDAARYLPFIPPLHAQTEVIMARKKRIGRLANVGMRIAVNAYAAQYHFYAADNTETATPGYALLNAGCNATWLNKKGKEMCTFYVQAENITDEIYQSNMSRLKYFEYYAAAPGGRSGIYNIGRNVSIKAIMPLGR
jgi:iron complex outermembrane receptor protein